MNAILEWLLYYALPALGAVSIAYTLPLKEQRIAIIHAGILISILLLSLTGVRLMWHLPLLYGGLLILVALGTIFLLGIRDALLYLLSCIIQESCILLAGTLLISVGGVILGALATALVFGLAHRMNFANWLQRITIIAGWGFCSIVLYAWLHEPILNITLHALGGAVLIYYGILFPNRRAKGITTF